jgi:hypothetical protein
MDNQYFEIVETSLTDPSKVPRDVAAEIFEANAIQVLGYKKIPNFKIKEPKQSLTSSDVMCYLKSLLKELTFFTFGRERDAKKICHIHRYFQLNLAPYVQRCIVELPKIDPVPEMVFEADTFLGKWRRTVAGDEEMFYIAGSVKTRTDRPAMVFGFSFVTIEDKDRAKSYLGQILGDFLDMRDRFKDASLRPEEVKQRDLSVLRKDFEIKMKEVYAIFGSKLNLIHSKLKKQVEQ